MLCLMDYKMVLISVSETDGNEPPSYILSLSHINCRYLYFKDNKTNQSLDI